MAGLVKNNPLKKLVSVRGMGQALTVTAGLIVLYAVFGIVNPQFLSSQNVANLLRQIAPIVLIGIGQSYVLITGNIDLSIGSIVGMSCMISATLMTKGVNPWAASLITLACCLVIGAFNGVLVSFCRLPSFIATLGTMTIARGVAQIVNGNYNTDFIGDSAEGFRNFFYYGKTFGVFNTVFIAAFLWLAFNFYLMKTKTGRHIYAIGSNIDAARLSGVNIITTTVKAYTVSAFTACVVGFINSAQSGMGSMDSGNMYELYAVAASVIGGVSPLGGQGLLFGTVIGASIWSVLANGLQFAGAPVAIRNIAIGIIVVTSVLLDLLIRGGIGVNLDRLRSMFVRNRSVR